MNLRERFEWLLRMMLLVFILLFQLAANRLYRKFNE